MRFIRKCRQWVCFQQLLTGQAQCAPPVESAMPVIEMAPAEVPMVSLSHDGRWAFGVAINGTQREIGLYVAPQPGALASHQAHTAGGMPSGSTRGQRSRDPDSS